MDHPPDRIRPRRPPTRPIAAWLVAWSALVAAQQPPPDATWVADVALDVGRSITDAGLGAVQGVVRNGMVYAYGDVVRAEPRVGVIREYTEKLEPTGCVVWLLRGGRPLIVHPDMVVVAGPVPAGAYKSPLNSLRLSMRRARTCPRTKTRKWLRRSYDATGIVPKRNFGA